MNCHVLGAVVLLLAAGGMARAELVCAPPEQPFLGEVRSGEPLSHRFVVQNASKDLIQILDLKPGCGCLRPKIDKDSLEPGQSALIEVDVNTVTQAEGRNNWRVTVHYREGAQDKELHLLISADVKRVVCLQPATVVIHTAGAYSHSLTLTEKLDAPLKITNVATRSPHVRVSPGTPMRQGDEWRRTIRLDVLPTFPEGRIEDVLCVYTSHPIYAELRFPFTVVKRQPATVTVAPAAVRLTVAGTAPLPARILLLSRGDDKAVVVDRVEADHPAIHCTWAAGPDTRATLRVQVEREFLPQVPYHGKVRVHLGDKQVEVPVSID